MERFSRLSAALVSAAALSLAATPAAAVELSTASPTASRAAPAAWSDAGVTAERSRWRHRRHHNDGIDAGDVIAGAVIIGGIAALAGAFDNDRDEPRVDYRYPHPAYQSGGLDRAVDMCVAEIERDVRVGSVDAVDRDAGGWRVSGSLYDGDGFTCRIGNDGRISDIDYGSGGVSYSTEVGGNQWSDEAYAAAWDRVDGPAPAPMQPAYPGGPLPGEDYEGY